MFEYEEQTEIIGARCTLHEAYKGYTEGTVVGDFGLSAYSGGYPFSISGDIRSVPS